MKTEKEKHLIKKEFLERSFTRFLLDIHNRFDMFVNFSGLPKPDGN